MIISLSRKDSRVDSNILEVYNLSMKNFLQLVGSLFAIIFVAHIFRLFYGWEVSIGEVVIPIWVSGLALAVSGGLAYFAFKFSKQ